MPQIRQRQSRDLKRRNETWKPGISSSAVDMQDKATQTRTIQYFLILGRCHSENHFSVATMTDSSTHKSQYKGSDKAEPDVMSFQENCQDKFWKRLEEGKCCIQLLKRNEVEISRL